MDFLAADFRTERLHAPRILLLWNPGIGVVARHIGLVIAVSCFTIPVALLWFVRKRRDLPFSWMIRVVWNFHRGLRHHARDGSVEPVARASIGWLEGLKAVTAVGIGPDGMLLARLMPKALALPSIAKWAQSNAALKKKFMSAVNSSSICASASPPFGNRPTFSN